MARRGRQTGIKSLGPGHRQRNKNPKLSPYQRELKRNRLANQAPRPYVNASVAGIGKQKAAAGITPVTPDTINPALMYQKRDTPAKARGLMQYLLEKEERQVERKRQREEELTRKETAEREEEEARLAYRERGENSDDEEGDEHEEEEYEEVEEVEEDEDEEECEEDDESIAEGDDMAALLADLKTSSGNVKKEKNKKSSAGKDLESDEELISSSDEDDEVEANPKMVLTHVPKNPSGKQLKSWMVKKERLAYLEMKEKGDLGGCEELLKKVLIKNGYTFIDPEVIKAQRKTKREQAAADAARRRAEREAEAVSKAAEEENDGAADEGGNKKKKSVPKKKKFKPILEGELSTQLEDLNEEMLYQHLPPNVAAAMALSNGGSTAPLDPHAAFAAESAMLNLKLLKKKEKKHLKKSVKRREKTIEEFSEMEQKIVMSMNKAQNKKIRKERALEGDANYRLHQKLANQQIENLKSGLNGPKRLREGEEHADTHDSNVVLKFQQYENEQNEKKNKVKRLSGMDESEINRLVEIEDKGGKVVEKIKFGERAEAPPVFSVVPTMNNSFAKFASKLGVNADGTPMKSRDSSSSNPITGKNKKINGVAVTSGGIRSQQNKPGKAMEMKLAAKSMKEAMKRSSNANIISTAARTDSATGEMTLYERKRLAKLGLMGPVTEQRINRSSVANGGEGNSSHNASEMELLRQRVMQTYQHNKKAARKNGGAAPTPAIPTSVSRSWLPTDRDY